MDDEAIVRAVRLWVESVVVGLNLCPFAGRELNNNKVRFAVSHATSEGRLLQDLEAELVFLNDTPAVETTLLIHPGVLGNFYDYNAFLDDVDQQLMDMSLVGTYQVASFHPNYQFAGTAADDVENFSNRSPYPLLHILREASLEKAIASYDRVDLIPTRNIALMRELGVNRLRALLQAEDME